MHITLHTYTLIEILLIYSCIIFPQKKVLSIFYTDVMEPIKQKRLALHLSTSFMLVSFFLIINI